MPYFVFRINNHREHLPLDQFETYREAREKVRSLRAEQPGGGIVEFRMVFAETETQARELLRSRRERTPSEDD